MNQRLFLILAATACMAFATLAHAESVSIPDRDTVFVEAEPPGPVPIVPLPPAVVGTAISVLLTVGLRYSRHRKWITLR